MILEKKKNTHKVKVKTNQKKQEIKNNNGVLELKIKSKPENNKANEEIILILKDYFNCENIKIIKGIKSKNKTIYLFQDKK